MTSSRRTARWCGALLLCTHGVVAWAALGETVASVEQEGARLGARRSVQVMARYSVQELQWPDGGRVQQYVAPGGRVFAVRWTLQRKPDLSQLLGSAFPGYASAAGDAGQRGGIQRQFRHDDSDVVVQTSGHLHAYAGYALRRSLLPAGVSAASLGWE